MAQGAWLTGSLGGYLYSPKLSKQMREQAAPMFVFRNFVDLSEKGLGANKGDRVPFSKRLRIDTRGGTLVETDTMPKNTIKFTTDSVPVTEYGNGVDYTGKLEALAEFNMKDQYQKGLVEDQKDAIDNAIATEFKRGMFKAVATSTSNTVFTSDGTATATQNADLSDKSVRDIVDYLMMAQTPKFKGGDHYIGILSVKSMRGVYDYLQAVAQYTTPEFRFKNEVGRYYGARHVAENNILVNTNGSGSVFGEALYFGDEAVVEAVAVPEELRYEEEDLGRSKSLAWYSILGFKKMWDLTNDDLNSTGKGIERIVHVTSA
jgi:N4-gp56 family major capsid protein